MIPYFYLWILRKDIFLLLQQDQSYLSFAQGLSLGRVGLEPRKVSSGGHADGYGNGEYFAFIPSGPLYFLLSFHSCSQVVHSDALLHLWIVLLRKNETIQLAFSSNDARHRVFWGDTLTSFCKTIDQYSKCQHDLFCTSLGDGWSDIYLPRMRWL